MASTLLVRCRRGWERMRNRPADIAAQNGWRKQICMTMQNWTFHGRVWRLTSATPFAAEVPRCVARRRKTDATLDANNTMSQKSFRCNDWLNLYPRWKWDNYWAASAAALDCHHWLNPYLPCQWDHYWAASAATFQCGWQTLLFCDVVKQCCSSMCKREKVQILRDVLYKCAEEMGV